MKVGATIVAALFAATGCGYSLVGYAPDTKSASSVAIETFRNDSYEAGIEYMVADALRREFLRRGAYRLTDDPAAADLVLSGKVRPVESRPESFSSVELAIEYQVSLELDLHATKSDGNELPISGAALRETEFYTASPDIEATRKNRQEALRHLAVVLAGRVHDALYENVP